MKKRKINQIDTIIERLSENFSKIKDFEILQESDEGKKMFDLIVKTTSEMEGFESLFINYYIPAANKSIAESWNQILNSKYNHLLNLSKSDLRDNLYETIRLGYVGLFHKYESYLNALVESTNFLLKEMNEISELLSINEYCRQEFGVNLFKSHDRFHITSRVNYISNCVKHYDGFANKTPTHIDLLHIDKSKKIEIEPGIFKSDIKHMKMHCQLLLSQVMIIGFRQFIESEINMENENHGISSEMGKKYNELKVKFELSLSEFINKKEYFT